MWDAGLGMQNLNCSKLRFVGILMAILLFLPGCKKQEARLDHISIAIPYELESLDPHERNTLSDFSMLSHFYEPLVTTDSSMVLQPLLADRWENPDLSTWILHLRGNVHFHDGKPMTSQDVVYTFQRLLKSPDLEMSGYMLNIAEVRAVNADTVEIRTEHPMSILLNKIRFVPIIPKGSTAESLAHTVNGTGPYKMMKWEKGSRMEIVRNDGYWGKKPDLAAVTFFLNQNPEAAIRSLMAGQCQFALCPTKKVEKINQDPRFQILRSDSLFLKYLSYDLLRDETPFCDVHPNPFKNPLVRRAMHLGIDRNHLVNSLSSYGVPASQAVPPFIFGFNPQIPMPQYNPEKAKDLLRQAGLPNGFHATLHAREIFREAAVDVRDQLEQIGIHLDLQVLSDAKLFDMLDHRQSSLFLSRFGCPTGDASDILDNSLHSVDVARHFGRHNYGDYSNPEMDREIEASAQTQDLEKRRAMLQHIMSIFMEDLVWIPLYIDQDVYAVDRRLQWQPRNDSFVLAWEIHPQ